MDTVDMIEFTDLDSGDEAFAFVRAARGRVALCLSLRTDGDLEVFFTPAECKRLIGVLQRAVVIAEPRH